MALVLACSTYDEPMVTSAGASGAAGTAGAGGRPTGQGGSLSSDASVESGGGAGGGVPGGDDGEAPLDADSVDAGDALDGRLGADARDAPSAPDASDADAASLDAKTDVNDTAPPTVDGPLEAGPLVEELIDNMEDNNNAIPLTKGRSGTWSVSHDDSPGGVQMPENPFTMTAITGRGASVRAAYTAGHGFAVWGAQLLVQLNQKGTSAKAPYDASAYAGISFWAKVSAAHLATVRVRVPDLNSDPAGAVCAASGCNDHHQSAPVTWTTEWQKYTYYFATDLVQTGFGTPIGPLDAAHIYEIQFTVTDAQAFEFWIDDLSFILK
jgi:hypothetical protein